MSRLLTILRLRERFAPVAPSSLLKEDGFVLLQETGDKILAG